MSLDSPSYSLYSMVSNMSRLSFRVIIRIYRNFHVGTITTNFSWKHGKRPRQAKYVRSSEDSAEAAYFQERQNWIRHDKEVLGNSHIFPLQLMGNGAMRTSPTQNLGRTEQRIKEARMSVRASGPGSKSNMGVIFPIWTEWRKPPFTCPFSIPYPHWSRQPSYCSASKLWSVLSKLKTTRANGFPTPLPDHTVCSWATMICK